MFEKCELERSIDRKDFEKSMGDLKERLGSLQRELHEKKIPVIIVIEGWNAAGITNLTHEIIQSLDPRGFTLHAIERPSDEERARPFMWRFWMRMPAKGRIAIFARSWYSRAISAEMQATAWKKSLDNKAVTLNNFERQLSDDGAIILKFFLHISKDEQKNRLEGRERNPLTAWLVTPAIWNLHRHYDDSLPIIDGFLYETNTDYAPWHIVEATSRDYAVEKVYSTMVKTLEKAVDEKKSDLQRRSMRRSKNRRKTR